MKSKEKNGDLRRETPNGSGKEAKSIQLIPGKFRKD